MKQTLNSIQNEIIQLKEEVEKYKKSYKINRRDDEYQSNTNYSNYDEEIINGESIFDCQIENIKRESKILSLYDEIIFKVEQIKMK